MNLDFLCCLKISKLLVSIVSWMLRVWRITAYLSEDCLKAKLSVNTSERTCIVLNNSKVMRRDITWFRDSYYKIALIDSNWAHPFATTSCMPLYNKYKYFPASSPTCLYECLFIAIISHTEATHFSALTSAWLLLEETHQDEHLDGHRKCWNREFGLRPSNKSDSQEIIILVPCRLCAFFGLLRSSS